MHTTRLLDCTWQITPRVGGTYVTTTSIIYTLGAPRAEIGAFCVGEGPLCICFLCGGGTIMHLFVLKSVAQPPPILKALLQLPAPLPAPTIVFLRAQISPFLTPRFPVLPPSLQSIHRCVKCNQNHPASECTISRS